MRELDLGNDKIFKTVLILALPAMLGQFINVLYSIVDRIYLSNLNEIGDLVLGGVGICSPIITLLSSFSFLIGIGGAPLLSMSLGEKNSQNAKKILANSFLALLVISVIVTLIAFIFKDKLLYSFGATNENFIYANEYFTIYLIGSIFAIMGLGLNQFIICQGYSKIGMATMIIGAVINVILDPIFIFTLNMGVSGAALATIISQIFSFLFVIYFLSKKSLVKISFGNYSSKLIKKIMKLGVSPFLIAASDAVVVIIINYCLKKYGGEMANTYITSFTIAFSFFSLITMPLLGISGGTGSVLSYNYGAKDIEKVKKAFKYIVASALVFTTICFGLSFIIEGVFIDLFTKNLEIKNLSAKIVRIFMIGIVPLSFQYCFVDGFTNLGVSKAALALSLNRKIMIILLTFFLPFGMGIMGCFYAEMIGDLIASLVTTIAFLFIINKVLNKRLKSIENII